jgi:hypothetical protein
MIGSDAGAAGPAGPRKESPEAREAGGQDARDALGEVAAKVVRFALACNIAVLLIGAAIGESQYGRHATVGYAAGFILSAVNIIWLYRIAGKGLTLPPDKVARFVSIRYYLRFIITALLCVALIKKGYVGPLPFLVGITTAVAANIAVMIIVAKREAS